MSKLVEEERAKMRELKRENRELSIKRETNSQEANFYNSKISSLVHELEELTKKFRFEVEQKDKVIEENEKLKAKVEDLEAHNEKGKHVIKTLMRKLGFDLSQYENNL